MNIVVLGGGIDLNGRFPEHVAVRLEKAIELYHKDPASLIILSGKYSYLYKDKNPPITEAAAMAQYLTEQGIPQDRLILEKNSQDTISNAYFLKTNIFIPRGLTNAVVVTSQFHCKRVEYIFNRVFGPDYSFTFRGVPESMNQHDRDRVMHYQKELLEAARKFLEPMKSGDHAYLADKFYNAPYYTKRERPSWVADFVSQGTWKTGEL